MIFCLVLVSLSSLPCSLHSFVLQLEFRLCIKQAFSVIVLIKPVIGRSNIKAIKGLLSNLLKESNLSSNPLRSNILSRLPYSFFDPLDDLRSPFVGFMHFIDYSKVQTVGEPTECRGFEVVLSLFFFILQDTSKN